MYRWYGLAEVPSDWVGCVATIGVFDGVHRGHQRIIGRAEQIARARHLPVVVITFDPHPDEVIRPGSHPPLLSTPRRRAELLAGLGADAVCVLPFNLEFSRLSPDEFVRVVLSERLHAAAVVVGENFRFGHKAVGDVPLLAQLGEKYDFTAEGVPLLVADGLTISSSYVREQLAAGDVATAAARWAARTGWRGLWSAVTCAAAAGFPDRQPGDRAAHRDPRRRRLRRLAGQPGPGRRGDGPLAGRDLGRHQPHVRHRRPHRGGVRLDRDDLDLYGVHAAIDFTARLRGTERFDSVQALITQMHEDVAQARALTADHSEA